MATGDNRLPYSSRAFLSAVRSGQVEVVRDILSVESRRNDINVQNDWGDTALLIAAQLGYLNICQMLLAGGACSAKQNNRGETCLHRACITGNVKIVEAILDRESGKVINKVDDEGYTALHFAVQVIPHPKAMELSKLLVQVGADVYIINNRGETSAAVARRVGNEQLAYYLETKSSNDEESIIAEMNCYKDLIIGGYKEALNSVYLSTTQLKLMLVGNSGTGKTSLKKTLFGEEFDPEELPTSGIDADPSTAKVNMKQYRDWVLQPTSKVEVHRLNLIHIDLITNHILNKIKLGSPEVRVPIHSPIQLPQEKKVLFRERDSIHIMSGISYDDRTLFSPVAGFSLSASQIIEENTNTSVQDSNSFNPGFMEMPPGFMEMPSPLLSHKSTVLGASSVTTEHESSTEDSAKSSFTGDLSRVPQEILRRILLRWNIKEPPKYLDSRCCSLSVCDTSGYPLMVNVTPLFFSRRCIYLGIFNLSEPFQALSQPHIDAGLTDVYGNTPTNADVLDEWLSAAAGQAKSLPFEPLGVHHNSSPRLPPIILVGSQVDKCESSCELRNVSEFINSRCFSNHMNQRDPPMVFTCSSLMESQSEYSNQSGLPHAGHHLLRREIDTIARQLPFSHEKIPLKWVKFQQIICSLKDQQKCLLLYQELSQFVKTQCPGQFTDVDIHIMFVHYHSLGSICYFSSHEQLSQLVVTDPQWLMTAITGVIKPPKKPWFTQAVKEEFTRLIQDGIIDSTILQLRYRHCNQHLQMWNQVIFIMDCLELVCYYPQLDKKQIMMPCAVVKTAPAFLTSPPHLKAATLCFKVDASTFPELLFYQVVVCCVRSATCYLPRLYRHLAHIQLTQNHHLILMKNKNHLLVRVEPSCEVCTDQCVTGCQLDPCYARWEENEFIQPEIMDKIRRKPLCKEHLVFEHDQLESICPIVLSFLQRHIEYLCACWLPGLIYNAEVLVNNCYISLDNLNTKEQNNLPDISVWLGHNNVI